MRGLIKDGHDRKVSVIEPFYRGRRSLYAAAFAAACQSIRLAKARPELMAQSGITSWPGIVYQSLSVVTLPAMFPIRLVLLLLFAILCCVRQAAAWPFIYQNGVTVYSPKKSFNSYTLFSPVELDPTKKENLVYLINMSGEVVHKWKVPYPPVATQLLPNGHLLMSGMSPEQKTGRPGVGIFWLGGYAGWLLELDWQGREVFRHKDLGMHHDIAKLPNGNYLYMGWEQVPRSLQAKVLGGIKGTEQKGGVMWNDYLVEVNPQGQRVWTWRANDHFDPKIDIIGPLYKRNEWCHGNSIDVLQNGNILLTSRSLDSIMTIDKKSGQILSRWGNAAYLDSKTGRIEYRVGDNRLQGPHDARVIPPGYPGAGRITVFDNRANTGDFLHSRVAEIDPTTQNALKTEGIYLGRKFLSDFLGGAQRLANGNTLVCDGANGRFFQMTPGGEACWEYINPYAPSLPLQGAVFQANAYGPDYCPQFKNLPPAEGAPVLPATSSANDNANSVNATQPSEAATPLDYFGSAARIALVIALGASFLLNILLWRQSASKR